MTSQWCRYDINNSGTYMSFPYFTREEHICPSNTLPGGNIYVLPILYQGGTYMSFPYFTKEEHICPSHTLPGRNIYVLPILYQGGTYMSFPYITREEHVCPSSPGRIKGITGYFEQGKHVLIVCKMSHKWPGQLRSNEWMDDLFYWLYNSEHQWVFGCKVGKNSRVSSYGRTINFECIH